LKGIKPFNLSAPIECLDRSLKTIMLQQYSGRKPHLDRSLKTIMLQKFSSLCKYQTRRSCLRKLVSNRKQVAK